MKIRFVSLLALLCFWAIGREGALAQGPGPTPEDNPSGNAGALKSQIQTAGSYDAHSGNATRSVTDLHVPGALGAYGLDFTRYWNSLHNDYDDPSAEWPLDFGRSGWSHSWHWKAEYTTHSEEIGNNGENEYFFTTITITFPDGHSTKYKIVRSRNGLGLPAPFPIHPGDPRCGPDYTTAEITSGWPDGGLGVEDHIHQMAFDGSSFWLARADGGSVRFIWVPRGTQGYYRATEVLDPHGFKTELHYNPDGYLWEVLQEGGRYLNIIWGYFAGEQRAITRVESGGGGSASQYVTYSYRQLDPINHAFLVLAKVGYPNDQGPGQSNSAVYSYGFDYAPGVAAQSLEPLLKFADDPRYGGPMTKIRYDYDNDHGGCTPPANPLLDPDFFSAQPYSIAAEKSGDTDVPPVSRFFLLCPGGIRVEYNGLGGWRKFFFGRSAETFEEAAGGPFKCRTYQLGKVTDFTSVPGAPDLPAGLPNQRQNFSFGDPRHTWDGRDKRTESFYEDGSGSPTRVVYADQSVEFYNRMDSSGSDQRDETRIPNPNHHWLFWKKDERGQTIFYRRDARRRVKQIDYPDGANSEYYTYNDLNQVLTHTLPSGAVEHYDYDGFQRLSREWNSIDGEAQSTNYGYDTLERVWTVQNARARANFKAFSARMTYNGRHQVLTVEYPGTGGADTPTVAYEYDKYGNCTAITDELGHRRVYTYDSYRRCTSYTEPLNAPGWNGTGIVPSRQWDWIYDRIIGATQYGPSSHTSKDWRVQVEPAFDEDGERRLTARNFDVNNRIMSEETGWIQRAAPASLGDWYQGPNFETHYFTYDENGQKKSFKDPLGRITDYTYNDRNWLWKTIEHPVPGNNTPLRTTETRYNAAGDKTLVIFPDLKTQEWPNYGYDAFGQPHVFIDERQQTTNLDYWPWGPMKKLSQVTTHRTNDDGVWEHQETRFYYDLMGRPQTTVFPDNSSERSLYEFGQVSEFKTRRNQTKRPHYDARGREDSHTWDDGAAPGVTRVWDDANRLTNISNVFSAIDYGYDDAGQAKWERSNVAGSTGWREISYCRYPSGEVSQMRYPNGTVINRFYTARGQLRSVGWGSGSTSYAYLEDGKVDYQSWQHGEFTKLEYNGRGMIFSVRHKKTANGPDLAFREYWRDDRDRVTAWKRGFDNSQNAMEDGRGDRYEYDPEGQLKRAYYRAVNPDTAEPYDPKRGDTFTYDELGNRVRWNHIASRGWMDLKRRNNKLNQYEFWENDRPDPHHWGTGTFYDDNIPPNPTPPPHPFVPPGNGVLMQDGYITAGFNALNQPVSMWSFAYWGTSNWMLFGYDPLGRCVKRTVGANPATYYYYDGWNLVQEGGSTGAAERIYVHGGRVDEIVASWGSGQWYHHHYDARGHCILLTDTGGHILEQYDYDAFGRPYFYNAGGGSTGSSMYGNRFLFTGREWISDMRIYDYRNRMYQPELGRFLQPDPKYFAAGDYNLYRYCHNDPVNKTDPTGIYEQDVHLILTEYLAINAGFSREAAHNIALANQRTDTNSLTSPYFGGGDARRGYHFTTERRRDAMRSEAFSTKSEEKFGRYLHALQDSYSHQRGGTDRNGEPYGANFGHLGDGHAPDKTANRPELANKMARETYNELRRFYQEQHGKEAPDNWSGIQKPIDDFLRTHR